MDELWQKIPIDKVPTDIKVFIWVLGFLVGIVSGYIVGIYQ